MKLLEKMKKQKWWSLAAGLCVAVILYFILQHLGWVWNALSWILMVISPLIVGGIIAYIVDPLVRLFERTIFKNMKRRSLARNISIGISLILIIAFIVVLMWLMIPQLVSGINSLIFNMENYINSLKNWLGSIAGGFFKDYVDKIDFQEMSNKLIELLENILDGKKIINATFTFGSSLFSFFMSFILAIYYLIDKNRIIKYIKKFCYFVFKDKRYKPVMDFASSCNKILVRYICVSLLEAVAVGVANAILMIIFGMPYVAIISLIVGVTNLAPTFGPIAGCIIGGFILLMVNPLYTLLFVIFTIVIQNLDGYVLKPKLFAGTLGVSSVLILISIIVLGKIFGVVGLLLAIPAAAIIQNLCRLIIKNRNEKKLQQSEDYIGELPPEEDK